MKELAKTESAIEWEKETKTELLKRSNRAKKAIENNAEKCWAWCVHDAKKKFRITDPSFSSSLSSGNNTILDMSTDKEEAISLNSKINGTPCPSGRMKDIFFKLIPLVSDPLASLGVKNFKVTPIVDQSPSNT